MKMSSFHGLVIMIGPGSGIQIVYHFIMSNFSCFWVRMDTICWMWQTLVEAQIGSKVPFKKQWFFASSSMESDGSFRVLK